MNGLALCAGIGGLDIGVSRVLPEYRTVCYVEREAFAAATLVARMADKTLDDAPVWDDLKTFDGKPWRGTVDIVTGGYPCQPFSNAGKRLGKDDPRHLWPDVRRIVSEVQPLYCFFENVSGHLRLGLDRVLSDLPGMGYRVACGLFTAEEVGAPHRRERVFILAYRDDQRSDRAGLHPRRGEEGAGTSQSFRGSEELAEAKHDGGRQRQHEEQPDERDAQERDAGAAGQQLGNADSGPSTLRGYEPSPTPGRGEWSADPRGSHGDEQRQGSIQSAGQPPRVGLADTQRKGREGRGGQCHPQGGREGQAQRSVAQCSFFPPGPDDIEGWGRFLAQYPEAQPSVCRDADGVHARLHNTDRVNRLRVLGNAVVPDQAAYAFWFLWKVIHNG